jgi:hypothetical protein
MVEEKNIVKELWRLIHPRSLIGKSILYQVTTKGCVVGSANVGHYDDNPIFDNRHRRSRLKRGRDKREFI